MAGAASEALNKAPLDPPGPKPESPYRPTAYDRVGLGNKMRDMSTDDRRAPRLIYEHAPCDDCERNVNAAFDILFDAVLKQGEAPVENPERVSAPES